MLGSLILYLKGMRTTMFQLSGFYGKGTLKGTLKGCQEASPDSRRTSHRCRSGGTSPLKNNILRGL